MPYEYFSDEAHLKEWPSVEKDSEKFKEFLEKNKETHIDMLSADDQLKP